MCISLFFFLLPTVFGFVMCFLDTFCSSAPMCYLYEIFLPPDIGSGSRKYMVNPSQRLLFCFSLHLAHLAFFADAGFHSSIILAKVGKCKPRRLPKPHLSGTFTFSPTQGYDNSFGGFHGPVALRCTGKWKPL